MSQVFIDSFKNHDVYIAVLTAERKKWEACAHVEKADEKHPSEDVVPVEVMVDEPDGALILWRGKATWGWQNRISFVKPQGTSSNPSSSESFGWIRTIGFRKWRARIFLWQARWIFLDNISHDQRPFLGRAVLVPRRALPNESLSSPTDSLTISSKKIHGIVFFALGEISVSPDWE